jgi:AcrR family transcriptional regulator
MKPHPSSGVNDGIAPAGRRDTLLTGAIDYALDHGLAGLSLRPMAAELGTSDRMLIYHFGSRDRLVAAILEGIADRLRALLAGSMPSGLVSPRTVLDAAMSASSDPHGLALLRALLQVVGLAAQGDEVAQSTGFAVTENWLDWLEDRLDVPEPDRRTAAIAVLVLIDGFVMLSALGVGEEARAGVAAMASGLAR